MMSSLGLSINCLNLRSAGHHCRLSHPWCRSIQAAAFFCTKPQSAQVSAGHHCRLSHPRCHSIQAAAFFLHKASICAGQCWSSLPFVASLVPLNPSCCFFCRSTISPALITATLGKIKLSWCALSWHALVAPRPNLGRIILYADGTHAQRLGFLCPSDIKWHGYSQSYGPTQRGRCR